MPPTRQAWVLCEEFAALHLGFAARVSELASLEMTDALQHWTPARRQAGEAWAEVGPVPDAHQLWRAYHSGSAATVTPRFGCFYHALRPDGRTVRLHFANREGGGVLGPDRLVIRRRELASTLSDARAVAPHAETLRGGSWLYHLAPYRSLFPPSFLASATPADPRNHLNSLSLWGQFLRGDGQLYEPRAEAFVRTFERATSVKELLAAFPLPRLNLVGSIEDVQVWLMTGPATDRHPEPRGDPH